MLLGELDTSNGLEERITAGTSRLWRLTARFEDHNASRRGSEAGEDSRRIGDWSSRVELLYFKLHFHFQILLDKTGRDQRWMIEKEELMIGDCEMRSEDGSKKSKVEESRNNNNHRWRRWWMIRDSEWTKTMIRGDQRNGWAQLSRSDIILAKIVKWKYLH